MSPDSDKVSGLIRALHEPFELVRQYPQPPNIDSLMKAIAAIEAAGAGKDLSEMLHQMKKGLYRLLSLSTVPGRLARFDDDVAYFYARLDTAHYNDRARKTA